MPQAIAYAYLAGMPPEYGLYAALVPCVIYALMGSSPHLAIGPVAVSALLVMAGVSVLEEPFTKPYIELVILAGLMIGILQFLIGVFRLGKLINLLSYPVITGFTSAASVIVIVNQFKDIFGIKIPRVEYLYETILHIGQNISSIHMMTLAIGILTFISIYIIKKTSKNIPYGLVVVLLGIAFSYFLNLEEKGVDIIGFVPSGFPEFQLPVWSTSSIVALLPTVILVTVIGIIEAVGIAKAIGNKHDYYKVRTNQELLALGLSKIGGSMFNALPSSGSFSRSALLNETSARTTVASLITVAFVIIALLFLTPLLFFLPKVILAVIIIYAVKNLFEWKLAKKLYKSHKADFIVMVVTFLTILVTHIEFGVLAGFILSVIIAMVKSQKPFQELKRLVSFNHKNTLVIEKNNAVVNVRIKDMIYFGNSESIKKAILESLHNEVKEIDIQIPIQSHLDSMGSKMINKLEKDLSKKDITMNVSRI